jgi:hypothetical protein
MTWNDYWNLKVFCGLGGMVLMLVAITIRAIIEWHEDCHVNDEPDESEPKAGKTLGL